MFEYFNWVPTQIEWYLNKKKREHVENSLLFFKLSHASSTCRYYACTYFLELLKFFLRIEYSEIELCKYPLDIDFLKPHSIGLPGVMYLWIIQLYFVPANLLTSGLIPASKSATVHIHVFDIDWGREETATIVAYPKWIAHIDPY